MTDALVPNPIEAKERNVLLPFDAPYDEEMERAVLGAVMLQQQMIKLLRLQVSDFYMIRHQQIWQAFLEIDQDGGVIDRITLRQKLKDSHQFDAIGGDLYVSHISTSTPSPGVAPAYAELIRRMAFRRRAMAKIEEMRGVAFDTERSVEEVMADLQIGVNEIRTGLRHDTMKDSKAIADSMLDLLGRDEPGVIATGFRRLDENLGGGLRRGNLNVFAAPSGTGKTWAVMNIARNILNQKRTDGHKLKVMFFSLEMIISTEFNPRLLALESGLSVNEINRAGKLIAGNATKQKQFTNAVDRASKMNLKVDDRSVITPAYIRDMVALHSPDVVIIDYLQLMSDDRYHGDNKHLKMTSIIESLKEIAKDSHEDDLKKAAFVVLSQLSRQGINEARGDKEPPHKEALKESGSIENHSANIVMIHQDDNLADQNMVMFAVRKNRFGDEYKGRWRKTPPMARRDPANGRMEDAGIMRREVDEAVT